MSEGKKAEFSLPSVMFDSFGQLQEFVIDGNFVVQQCETIFAAMLTKGDPMSRQCAEFGMSILARFRKNWFRVVESEMRYKPNLDFVDKNVDNKKE